VLQIFAAVGLTGWISLYNGQKAVNELATKLREEASERVAQGLRQYLESSQAINRINEENIRFNHVDLENPNSLTRSFWKQRFLFDNVCGAAMYFGNSKGEFIGLGLQEDQNWRIGRAGKSTNGKFYRYASDNQGNATDLVRIFQDFDPRKRPWYQDAAAAGKVVWTRPYIDYARQEMKLALAQPIYDKSGKLRGVIGVDCLLSSIGRFLENIKIGKSGKIFIIDRTDKLIANSIGRIPFRLQSRGVKASDSQNFIIAATANHIKDNFGEFSQIVEKKQFDFYLNSQRKIVQVTPFSEKNGLDWLIVVVVPESDFMGTINTNTRITILLCLVALLLSVVMGILTARWLVYPILITINAADALSQGDWYQHVPESKVNELALLAKAFNRTAKQLKNSFVQLEYNASHDALTDLFNQKAFNLKLQEAIKRSKTNITKQENHPHLFAILFLDLDFFKLINDSLGHLVGDQVLIEVARRLRNCVSEADVIARFGGDEFIILLQNIVDVDDAIQVANKILQICKQAFDLGNERVFISTSIGIVMSSNFSERPEDFLRDADNALYCAKSSGKAGYRIFDAKMYTETVERLQLEIELRKAIENEDLTTVYQPIIDANTQQIIGFEALVRWQNSTGKIVSPTQFIPVAEETGLIMRLDLLVLRMACLQLKIWQRQFQQQQPFFISVNLSGKQFLQSDLLVQIEKTIDEIGINRSCLKLEITESILINYQEITKAKIRQIVASGIHLTIDDFGTGYSSLSYLHQFPFSMLKIDRSFIHNLGENDENLEIVKAITGLAHNLGMDVVAEGVETKKQLEQLLRIGCKKIQGYFFSPPLSSTEATNFLANDLSQYLG
jgi:diguanylate cyclase (GGDEF)-like protein